MYRLRRMIRDSEFKIRDLRFEKWKHENENMENEADV